MKHLRPILCIVFLLLLAGTGFSQRRFSGKVTEVIDGKTVVIEVETGKLTAVLQHIEIPEPEQPLYGTVREHLEKLVLGKKIEFRPQGMLPTKSFGQLYVGGLDIAQQMLRDGGAWHIGSDRSGQDKQESSAYQYSQDQAKNEKRGVWSIADMKPAWQFRAEREELRKQQEELKEQSALKARMASAVPANSANPAANGTPKMWADKNPALSNVGALLNGYNAEKKTGYISTPLMGISGLDKEGEQHQKDKPSQQVIPEHQAAMEITYIYKEGREGRTGVYVIGLVSYSKEWKFLRSNSMVITADEKRVVTAKAKRTTDSDGALFRERLTYELRRSDIEAIANSNEMIIKIGNYPVTPTHGLQMVLYNLLQASK